MDTPESYSDWYFNSKWYLIHPVLHLVMLVLFLFFCFVGVLIINACMNISASTQPRCLICTLDTNLTLNLEKFVSHTHALWVTLDFWGRIFSGLKKKLIFLYISVESSFLCPNMCLGGDAFFLSWCYILSFCFCFHLFCVFIKQD